MTVIRIKSKYLIILITWLSSWCRSLRCGIKNYMCESSRMPTSSSPVWWISLMNIWRYSSHDVPCILKSTSTVLKCCCNSHNVSLIENWSRADLQEHLSGHFLWSEDMQRLPSQVSLKEAAHPSFLSLFAHPHPYSVGVFFPSSLLNNSGLSSCLVMVCRYEREETFMALNLGVTSCQSLEISLDQFVRGEVLDGSNAYYCEKCKEKVRLDLFLLIKNRSEISVYICAHTFRVAANHCEAHLYKVSAQRAGHPPHAIRLRLGKRPVHQIRRADQSKIIRISSSAPVHMST